MGEQPAGTALLAFAFAVANSSHACCISHISYVCSYYLKSYSISQVGTQGSTATRCDTCAVLVIRLCTFHIGQPGMDHGSATRCKNMQRVRACPYGAGPPVMRHGHVHHPFHPLLQEHVEYSGIDLATRDPRRLCPAFRRGHKIGGADCGLAVRDQRNWKWRRGSASVVSTIGGGRVLAAALEVKRCGGCGSLMRANC